MSTAFLYFSDRDCHILSVVLPHTDFELQLTVNINLNCAHWNIFKLGGSIIVKKTPRKLNLAKWKGRCGGTFAKLGYSSVDKFIDDVRGR